MMNMSVYSDSIPPLTKTIVLEKPQITLSLSFNRESELIDTSNGFKDRVARFLEIEIEYSSIEKIKEFIRTPHLYPDMLERFEQRLIRPDTFVRGYVYLYVLEKSENNVKFKIGVSTNVDLRRKTLKSIIGDSIEFYTFTAKSIFEIEHFLKVWLDEYKVGNPEIFEMPVGKFENVLFNMDKFQGVVGMKVLQSNERCEK